jgi:predicted secreted protein
MRAAQQPRPLDRESCTPASSRLWELHNSSVHSIVRAAHQRPPDYESCTTAASTRSWELHTSVVPIMRAVQHQRPLDRESCTPASTRLWELHNSSVHSIVRAAHQRPPDYESCSPASGLSFTFCSRIDLLCFMWLALLSCCWHYLYHTILYRTKVNVLRDSHKSDSAVILNDI